MKNHYELKDVSWANAQRPNELKDWTLGHTNSMHTELLSREADEKNNNTNDTHTQF